MYGEGVLKSFRPSLHETRDKYPLSRDQDRNCYHRVKLSSSQPLAPWIERQHTHMVPPMSMEPLAATKKAFH